MTTQLTPAWFEEFKSEHHEYRTRLQETLVDLTNLASGIHRQMDAIHEELDDHDHAIQLKLDAILAKLTDDQPPEVFIAR